MNELLEQVFECIRTLLIEGNSDIGIPSLNPLKIANVSMDLANIEQIRYVEVELLCFKKY